MLLIDTSLRRESNCPVHFIWDGNGLGRPFVRAGFLLALVAGAAITGARVVPAALAPTLGSVAFAAGVVGGVAWLTGQVLTRVARRALPLLEAPRRVSLPRDDVG